MFNTPNWYPMIRCDRAKLLSKKINIAYMKVQKTQHQLTLPIRLGNWDWDLKITSKLSMFGMNSYGEG